MTMADRDCALPVPSSQSGDEEGAGCTPEPSSENAHQPRIDGWTDQLRALPTDVLRDWAWQARQDAFAPSVTFSVPGARRYDTKHYVNRRHSFAEISLTGSACALRCEHCRGKLLAHMRPATTPAALTSLAQRLAGNGCTGVLLSGGADSDGRIDFAPFYAAIAAMTRSGTQVLVHTGLLSRQTAEELRRAGVHQVLLDLIGDAETIRQVYHLERTPDDYLRSLRDAREAGLLLAPHIVLGLNAGQIRGEYRALSFATEVGVESLVVVVLRPLPGTPFASCRPPSSDDVGRFVAIARILNPRMPIALGCARPPGPTGAAIEQAALLAGANTIAFPSSATVEKAHELGLSVAFAEMCCSLA